MSTFQKLTLIGMYNYNTSLFDNVNLPGGYDKDTFIDTLLLEHGEKCVLYTDFDFLKYSFGAISRKWYLELTKILEALKADYNPVYNYDRYEVIGDTVKKKFGEKTTADYSDNNTKNLEDKRTANLEDKRTANLEDKTTFNSSDTTEQLEDATVENQVSAYNESTYQPKDKTTTDNGKTKISHDGNNTVATTGTDTIATTGTDTETHTGTDNRAIKGTLSDKSGGEDVTNTHNAHIYGNVGVTTATHMIDEILAQRTEKNLYEIAARIFANELLINLY